MPPAEFEPTIPASERPQTHALYRAANGIGPLNNIRKYNSYDNVDHKHNKAKGLMLLGSLKSPRETSDRSDP
jgi:hypothetical protein